MNVRKIGLRIRDYLRDVIQDPIKREGDWIHLDSPPRELKNLGKTPVIFIERDSSPSGFRTIGGGNEPFLNYNIHVFCRNKDGGTIDEKFISHSNELMDELVNKISEKMIAVSANIETKFHDGDSYIRAIEQKNIGGYYPIDEVTFGNRLTYEVVPI